ncbi:MAG: BolA family transcriptional regulator [Proteobacteria bacterium]|nr:BolA family transcriptional regulator [Pseudomonadota bacterium]
MGIDEVAHQLFRITAFADTARLERQRAVYRILADDMASDIHALALSTLTPEEDTAP